MTTFMPVTINVDSAAELVMNRAKEAYAGAPNLQPKHVAPFLGITENAFTKHCRNCSKLRLWRGSYSFFTDDPEHMDLLKHVIKRVLWSGKKLPEELRQLMKR